MNIFVKIGKLFWNKEEKRLRAIWRLGLHTGLLVIINGLFSVSLLFLGVVIDLVGGTNLQNVIDGSAPMQMMENPWVGRVILPAATFAGVLLATLITGKWIDRRKFLDFGMTFSKTWWSDFAFGLGLGAVLMGVIFLIGLGTNTINVTGYFISSNLDVNFLSGFIQSALFFAFVGFYEEILSRGYHLINLAEGFNHKIIGRRWALTLSFFITSLIFGLLHLGNPNATWISTLNITLAGVFLGLGMVLTGSLAIPIGLHITWNLFQGSVFGFPVSGVKTGVTLIATELTGPQWLTGGLFGPEAGVLGLAAMVIGSIITILWLRRSQRSGLKLELADYQPIEVAKSERNME
jgi:membrane protease YdiL (CAAX protease family)